MSASEETTGEEIRTVTQHDASDVKLHRFCTPTYPIAKALFAETSGLSPASYRISLT